MGRGRRHGTAPVASGCNHPPTRTHTHLVDDILRGTSLRVDLRGAEVVAGDLRRVRLAIAARRAVGPRALTPITPDKRNPRDIVHDAQCTLLLECDVQAARRQWRRLGHLEMEPGARRPRVAPRSRVLHAEHATVQCPSSPLQPACVQGVSSIAQYVLGSRSGTGGFRVVFRCGWARVARLPA